MLALAVFGGASNGPGASLFAGGIGLLGAATLIWVCFATKLLAR
jgi:hypothetical protein